MRLRHMHLPSLSPSVYPPYSLASRLQEHLRRQLLDYKDAVATATSPPRAPLPTLLSFTPLPVFTLGRRQTEALGARETSRLQSPLHVLASLASPSWPLSSSISPPVPSAELPVSVEHSLRGGLTTFHGPGQTVLWPVLDLKSAHHKQFTVRCYSRLLENTTIATLRQVFGIEAFTTGDPGVWVRSHGREEAKIAALGVHLRRHVSALGTAVNVAMPGSEVVDERVNPWARIVPCGLEGKKVTSVAGELKGGRDEVDHRLKSGGFVENSPTATTREEAVARAWARELAGRIGVDGVEEVAREEVLGLARRLLDEDGVDATGEREYVALLER